MWFSEFIIQRFIWISNLQHYFELDDCAFLGKKPTKKQPIMIIAPQGKAPGERFSKKDFLLQTWRQESR